MTTPLAQIQEEIAKLEERLKLLRLAETALHALENRGPALIATPGEPARGLAASIRELLAKNGPMTKSGIDKGLSGDEWSLGKGSVSGALQAMKARGVVARTKTGKWTVK